MDQRIESFVADVLALAGEDPDAVREGVRFALADCQAIFRAQEANKRMRDKAALACRALCRARRDQGTRTAPGNANGGAPEACAQLHRPAGMRRALTARRFPPPWSVAQASVLVKSTLEVS
jgi:hypothetical protein